MREHEYTVELPHAAPRLWALFQRYDLWKEYAPAVLDVEIVYPGRRRGNGLLRRVVYPLPFGRRGRVVRAREEREAGRRLRLRHDPLGPRRAPSPSSRSAPNRTRLRFRERFNMKTPVLRWFEASIYRFINKKNEESMRGASAWLEGHPEFHPELRDA
jgi:hypothetical protein